MSLFACPYALMFFLCSFSMFFVPGCIGQMLTDRFGPMLAVASGAAIFSGLAGTYISYFLNGETGACIVLTQATIFTLAALFGPKYGVFSRARAARQATEKHDAAQAAS